MARDRRRDLPTVLRLAKVELTDAASGWCRRARGACGSRGHPTPRRSAREHSKAVMRGQRPTTSSGRIVGSRLTIDGRRRGPPRPVIAETVYDPAGKTDDVARYQVKKLAGTATLRASPRLWGVCGNDTQSAPNRIMETSCARPQEGRQVRRRSILPPGERLLHHAASRGRSSHEAEGRRVGRALPPQLRPWQCRPRDGSMVPPSSRA